MKKLVLSVALALSAGSAINGISLGGYQEPRQVSQQQQALEKERNIPQALTPQEQSFMEHLRQSIRETTTTPTKTSSPSGFAISIS